MENKIKRCFLNNVLQRFDKKDKGTTGTKDFTRLASHRQWGKFCVLCGNHRRTHTSARENATNTERLRGKRLSVLSANTFEAIFELSLTHPKAGAWKLPKSTKYRRLLPLHYAVFVCSLLSFCNAIFGTQEFLGKPQKFNLTRRDNFSITFASQIKREEREDRMEKKFWRKSWSSYAWKWKYKAWILCLLL